MRVWVINACYTIIFFQALFSQLNSDGESMDEDDGNNSGLDEEEMMMMQLDNSSSTQSGSKRRKKRYKSRPFQCKDKERDSGNSPKKQSVGVYF